MVGLFRHNIYICCKLVVCGGIYSAFDFCGDPRLVEACRREFAGDVLFL